MEEWHRRNREEWHRRDSIEAEHYKPVDPAIIDSAFRAAADSLQPFVAVRDSALPLIRADSGTAAADDRFMDLDRRLERIVATWYSRLPSTSITEWSNWGRPGIDDSLEALLGPRSLRFRWSEGALVMTVDHGSLSRLFGPFLTPPMARYLAIVGEEDAHPMFEDGGVQLPWDSLGDRVATWEEFLEQYPRYPLRNAIDGTMTFYRDTYLAGTGNSPLFPYEGDPVLFPEIRASFERFRARHPSSHTAQLVAALLVLLHTTDFRHTAAADSFFTAHGITRY